MRTDKDRDMNLDKTEMKRLMLRFNHNPNFKFNEKLFKKKIGDKDKYPIGVLMEVIRNLMDDDVPESENIFTLTPERY